MNQMSRGKVVLFGFAIMVLVQLYLPLKMIWDRESIINYGVECKFRTAPVDPNDPFRGKYITLSYEDNVVDIEPEEEWSSGELIYVTLTTDSDGFTTIGSISKVAPDNLTEDQIYLKTKVDYVLYHESNTLRVEYPFNRFYMSEFKAYDAELVYNESQRDTTSVTYALVSIKDGEALLKDILIDGVSIGEIVKEAR